MVKMVQRLVKFDLFCYIYQLFIQKAGVGKGCGTQNGEGLMNWKIESSCYLIFAYSYDHFVLRQLSSEIMICGTKCWVWETEG